MSNKSWVLFIILVGLVAILSSSTSFFFLKSRSLEKEKGNSPEISGSNIEASSSVNVTPKSTSETVKTVPTSERPSAPADTYKVQKNETLFEIAQKFNQTWTEIVSANGLNDANKIMAGQTLIIPQNEVVNFKVNQDKAAELQKATDAGKNLFRLSPEETVKFDSPPVYGINNTDQPTLKSKENGEAIVLVKKEGETFQIKLTQPITKGDKGIWAILSIAPVR